MRQHRNIVRGIVGGLLTLTLAAEGVGCAARKTQPAEPLPAPQPQAPQPRAQTRPAVAAHGTLYERLGGEAVVRAVVEDFVSRAAADPSVNFTRAGTPNAWEATPENLERLKQRLVEFISTVAGGPMQYQGKDMVSAHKGMAIRNGEFDALAGQLRAALETNNVPRRERDELMEIFAGARGAIVEVADAPTDNAPQFDAPAQVAPAPDAPAPEAVRCPPSS